MARIKIIDRIRQGLRKFLDMQPANKITITLNEGSDHLTNCVKNRVWYIGKANQLESLYRQLDGVQSTVFWKAPMTKGLEIRKTHSGIPPCFKKLLPTLLCR